jgi:hypothetical protein
VLEPVVARYRGGAIKRRFFRGDGSVRNFVCGRA